MEVIAGILHVFSLATSRAAPKITALVRRSAWILGFLLTACGDSVGEPCTFRGSGFTLRDSCRSKCLGLSTVVCPSGESVQPAVCAGLDDCEVGGCPQDQACYHFDDPFDVVAYCIPVTVCMGGSPRDATIREWEVAAERRAAASRERFRKQNKGDVR